ncbi:MAG TPA: TlpA disulfide reductase family protein [Flavobacteriales bacterium]|nr:TlpA disulfide reductase family protein [Flavobacteriales bacterium]HRJ37859.1 TlpA disulfide reductase family protein [Flavobacteriales bacterium]
MMKRVFHIVLLFALLANTANSSESARISGKATGMENRTIAVHVIEDYFTYTSKKIAGATINENGFFDVKFPLDKERQIQIKIDGTVSFMYVQPGGDYKITIEAPSSPQKKILMNTPVDLLFDTLPKYDINNLILDFDERLDAFMAYNLSLMGGPKFQLEIDTLKDYLTKIYKDIKSPYFKEYVFYSIGAIEQIGGAQVDMIKLKAKVFRDYFASGKIIYDQEKYMLLFQQFYTDVFKLTSKEDDAVLYTAINKRKSPKMISELLAKDALLRNERIRELVIIKAVSEEYYTGNYYQDNIVGILDSIRMNSVYPEHKVIASNMKRKLTELNPGYPAPDFELINDKGKTVTLTEQKGKYVYLHFWASWNSTAMAEMKLMTELHKRYSFDITFISVNMDEDPALWMRFLKAHPEMKWIHVHYKNNPEIIDNYRITTLSMYYLIGPDGIMVQSPAYKPTPNGTFVSIDQTFHEIWMRLHPKEKPKTGGKN